MLRFTPDPGPSYGTQLADTFRTQMATMGDGYRQSADDGPNNIQRKWKVSFTSITSAKAAAIRAFFRSTRLQPFLWRPPAPDDALTLAVNIEGDVQHSFEKFNSETVAVQFAENFSATERVAQVIFTENDGMGTLSLTTPTGGAVIRYTADGTIPTESNGLPYVAPLVLSEDIIWQAIALHPAKLPSLPASHQFFA